MKLKDFIDSVFNNNFKCEISWIDISIYKSKSAIILRTSMEPNDAKDYFGDLKIKSIGIISNTLYVDLEDTNYKEGANE